MPESKHHRKGKSHSSWRKNRNNQRAARKAEAANERRAIKRMIQLRRGQGL